MPSAPHHMIGSRLSHYTISAPLGAGGMGVVYRAVDARLNRTVALKVIAPDAVSDPDRKQRFVREARAASALSHPNIVTIHDIGGADGVDFLVMELVSGQPLDRLMSTEGLPIERAGGDAPLLRSSRDLRLSFLDFVIRSGRALLHPVYKGTYERHAQVAGMNDFRDLTIARVKDAKRSIDCLVSRADIDRDRLGFYGVSLGAFTGVLFTAMEPRPLERSRSRPRPDRLCTHPAAALAGRQVGGLDLALESGTFAKRGRTDDELLRAL